ncbi:ArdC-like ssDNA-binding domain-containing protein [Herbiconiux daphne]|uniref:ArdC-like ssDNA-binding domain-containing protein n=1 Tax=Herbiconiux daphne TaxID=2970914 RepID=A0ABT2GWT1_9MICO|nr:ArdC-like ssDNA-binding domain-containing protein [Herbiconiux daphne]MCS5732422.1 ArdC-like ssDNA-binding domain-containing protein [Herbiconiux daphne]
MTTRTKTSPEERRAQAEALHENIAAQVEALRGTAQWERFLQFAGAFHAYSLNNVLLILRQRPDATRVAGFRKWQQLGRQVRKGEHAIRIFGYSTKKTTEEDDNGDDVEKITRRFPILSVFDISQTDLIDGEADPTTITQQLTGLDDHGVIETLTEYLAAEGWDVQRKPLAGQVNGYAQPDTRTVAVREGLAPEHAAKTLIHETAHIELRHVDDLEDYAAHRGLNETEAESVAYVIAGLLGFDTSAYSIGYIAGWAEGDTDIIRSTASRVLKAVDQLADILAPAELDEPAEV